MCARMPFCSTMQLSPHCDHCATTAMLRSGNQIRLTRREAETFKEITDFEPEGVRTLDDLQAYVARCKQYYHGTSYATRFLHWLIDEQCGHCITARAAPWHARR